MNLSKVSEKLVPANYLKLAQDAQTPVQTMYNELLQKRTLPNEGWRDEWIEEFVRQISMLDSNNYPKRISLGEREARIACALVARRHYNFGHGIGRSGDLLAAQPKAAGSTLLGNLTNSLLLDLIHAQGIRSCAACILVPMATGMTLTLCMLTLKKQRPQAKYVLWSRIDQKSCFKSILTAGLTPVVVELCMNESNNTLSTDLKTFETHLNQLGAENIVCIYSTTSCFAPRNSDDIVGLADLAQRFDVPHLVNNAYGLQSCFYNDKIEAAQRKRIDLFVQSTDKNLMVPVGAAIVGGFDKNIVLAVAKNYPGRASSSQSLDVLMTLLSLGKSGYQKLSKARKNNFKYLRTALETFAVIHETKVIAPLENKISLALCIESLSRVLDECHNQQTADALTMLGSMLFTRLVNGVRIVVPGKEQQIDGYTFKDWGSHYTGWQKPYLTAAAGIGVTEKEIDDFIAKLSECWKTLAEKQADTTEKSYLPLLGGSCK